MHRGPICFVLGVGALVFGLVGTVLANPTGSCRGSISHDPMNLFAPPAISCGGECPVPYALGHCQTVQALSYPEGTTTVYCGCGGQAPDCCFTLMQLDWMTQTWTIGFGGSCWEITAPECEEGNCRLVQLVEDPEDPPPEPGEPLTEQGRCIE